MKSTDRLSDDADDERRRDEYEQEWNDSVGSFFHPKAESCPWCGSSAIGLRIRVADTRQCKPGTFDMDECSSCGHIFQNPRLTDTGLAYYYRDFYDGLGREHYASVAEYATSAYRKRARLLGTGRNVAHWLDVGARHGHLCREARMVLPGAKFWALDPSPEILVAADNGWVDCAARTSLVEFAREHRAVFDAVSAIHYLERTAAPWREVRAMRELLRTGGVALVELVNPRSRFARLHGRFWYCWMAPQNLHLMPWRNMCELLENSGFVVSQVQLGKVNKPFDNLAAVLTALNYYLPPAKSWPWLRRRVGLPGRLLRAFVMVATAPVLLVAVLLDLLSQAVTTNSGGGNAYRIVAVAR